MGQIFPAQTYANISFSPVILALLVSRSLAQGILYFVDWTGVDWTGLVKHGPVKRGLVKRRLVIRGRVKRGLVKRGLVKRLCYVLI